MRAADLPWMGLGLSSNLDAAAHPMPYRMKDADPSLFDFVEYSAPLSVDEARAHASLFEELYARRAEVPVLFHPVHLNLFGPELEDPSQLRELDQHAAAVGSPWVGNDVGWWHKGGEAFPGYLYLSPPMDERGLEDAVAHALHVQSHLTRPLVLENPAFIAVRGGWHVLDFMATLHARTGLPLLIDLGHLFSYQLARGISKETGFDGFPWESVVELHLAGGVVTRRGARGVYVDDHTQPVREELFDLLEAVLPRCLNLKALTFEGDGHPENVAALTLRRLRGLVPQRPSTVADFAPAPFPVTPLEEPTLQTDVVALFDESYGRAAPTEDPEGTTAELDFRLAVVAQTLDRALPLTRLLLAGTREQLLSFMRSDAFGQCFIEGGRTVERAFFSWAATRIRELNEPAAEAVLALESMRQRQRRGAPAFAGPVDLTEADFAARALRRHLLDRAWVSGTVEQGGLDALWQVVRRAYERRQA